MENGLFLIGLVFVSFAFYRILWRRVRSPQAIVRDLLRRYHAFERTGLPQQESLLRVLLNRGGWKTLPPVFLAEIIARLKSKENFFRFVSLAEGYRYNREQLPTIAANPDRDAAVLEVALWLANFGRRLEQEKSLKEAEFVQKLALELEPDQFFTKLPLATTYYHMERYDDAARLFKAGLAQLEKSTDGTALLERVIPGADLQGLRAGCEDMYGKCRAELGKRQGSPS